MDLGYSPKKRGKMLVLLNIAPMNLITWYCKYLRTHVYTYIIYIYIIIIHTYMLIVEFRDVWIEKLVTYHIMRGRISISL